MRASAARGQAGSRRGQRGAPTPHPPAPGPKCVRSQPRAGTSEAPAGRRGSGLARTTRPSRAQRPAPPGLRECGWTAGRGPGARVRWRPCRKTARGSPSPARTQRTPAGRGSRPSPTLPGRGGGVVGVRPAPGSGPGRPFRIRPSVRVSVSVRPTRARGRGKCRAGQPQCAPHCPAQEASRAPGWGPGLGFRARRGGGGDRGAEVPGVGWRPGSRLLGGDRVRAAGTPPGPQFPRLLLTRTWVGCVGWDGARGRDAPIRPLATVGISGCGFLAQPRSRSFLHPRSGGGRTEGPLCW